MDYPGKGGRGRKAPYESVMYRIPAPIKPVVETLAEAYRRLIGGSLDTEGADLLKSVEIAIASATYPDEKVAGTEPHPSESYTKEQLQAIVETILGNPDITRKGKDRGAIKRGLQALLNQI
jgi:hypothetical protein